MKYDNFFNCEDYLKNLQDTSFYVSKMDIIILVCTSLIHLSGLISKKTLLLLSYVHEPRWGKEEGCLYPNLQIIPQEHLNNWGYCLTEIREYLSNLKYNRRIKC